MTTQKIPFKDRIIPWYFVLFFVILAIVNVIFVTLAIQSHPDVVQENAYETGLHYNEIIKQYNQQSKLDWQTSFDLRDNKITLNLKDKSEKPITKAKVKLLATSVLNEKAEIYYDLSEINDGHYTTRLNLPHQGQWDISLAISKNGNVMQIKKRFLLD